MSKKPLKIFVSAGEASGDMHGANLVRELKRLRPDAIVYGLGGPRLAEVGCEVLEDTVKRSGMWFWHVWTNFFHYLRILRELVSGFVLDPPDAVLLIDSPGFNVRVAAHAKARNIPVIYYITPQAWAWASMRFPKIARRVDKMLNILPFEQDLWRKYGVDSEYVGHPIFDHLASLRLPPVQRVEDLKAPLIGLLPGSRYREIDDLLPIMLDAAKIIKAQLPGARFRLVCAQEGLRQRVDRVLAAHDVAVEVEVGPPYDLMRQATLCLVKCGTANLELAYFDTPMVALYRVVWYAFWVWGVYVSTDWISIANILMGRQMVPECVMLRHNPEWVARQSLDLLQDESKRRACLSDFKEFRDKFGRPGASARVAARLLEVIEKKRPPAGNP
jgi:lipid-A-disaccharide synthase